MSLALSIGTIPLMRQTQFSSAQFSTAAAALALSLLLLLLLANECELPATNSTELKLQQSNSSLDYVRHSTSKRAPASWQE